MTDVPLRRGQLLNNESMALHTSWRAGGAVSQFYIPADLRDLTQFLQQLSSAS